VEDQKFRIPQISVVQCNTIAIHKDNLEQSYLANLPRPSQKTATDLSFFYLDKMTKGCGGTQELLDALISAFKETFHRMRVHVYHQLSHTLIYIMHYLFRFHKDKFPIFFTKLA
jgi:hypothetical protein